jgi:hypothetical protein
MIGNKFNMDEVFFRDLTICLLDTLEGRLKWLNRFSSGDIDVEVPIYYSLSGDERFLLDSFQDDIVSENRYVELNTDQIPRGHLTLSNFNIRSDEFRNPNVWLRSVVEDNEEIRTLLKQVRAIPITVNYDLSIILKSEIDVFKCSQEIMNTLWLYKFMYFEHNYMNIDAIVTVPDTETVDIVREKNLKSDNNIKLSLALEVQTYYPAFRNNNVCKVCTTTLLESDSNIIKVGPLFTKKCGSRKESSASISDIAVGLQVTGRCIPNGTLIKSIDPINFELTLSKKVSCSAENVPICISPSDGNFNDVVYPYRTRWFSNLYPLSSKAPGDRIPNANNNNPDFNSNQK